MYTLGMLEINEWEPNRVAESKVKSPTPITTPTFRKFRTPTPNFDLSKISYSNTDFDSKSEWKSETKSEWSLSVNNFV